MSTPKANADLTFSYGSSAEKSSRILNSFSTSFTSNKPLISGIRRSRRTARICTTAERRVICSSAIGSEALLSGTITRKRKADYKG